MASIATFSFDGTAVRTVTLENGEPWFVATDVANILGYSEAYAMTRTLDEDEKGPQIVRTLGGDQELTAVSESGLYSAIMRSRRPEAKAFRKWVTSEVLPSLRKTGSYSIPEAAPIQIHPEVLQKQLAAESAKLALILAAGLNVCESAKIGMLQKAVAMHDPASVALLPVYAVDAPTGSASAASSQVTKSLDSLLKQHGLSASARKVNVMLLNAGLLEERTRPSTSGTEIRKFKAVTEAGLQYGKNVTNPANQKEVQPHWYESTFEALLDHIGMAVAA